MHEVIEGLWGIEVVADDFIVVGFGDTEEQAIEDHDANLEAFMKRCAERNLRLNIASATTQGAIHWACGYCQWPPSRPS